jgi:hypothetical protein
MQVIAASEWKLLFVCAIAELFVVTSDVLDVTRE